MDRARQEYRQGTEQLLQGDQRAKTKNLNKTGISSQSSWGGGAV